MTLGKMCSVKLYYRLAVVSLSLSLAGCSLLTDVQEQPAPIAGPLVGKIDSEASRDKVQEQPAPIIGPLVGKIYSEASREWSRDEVQNSLLDADVIYLGEQHVNSEHHRLQREIIQYLLDQKRRPAIVIEAAAFDQSSALITYTSMSDATGHAGHNEIADSILRKKLQWGKEDDYYWRQYGGILQLARENNLQTVGMDLPKSLRYRISQSGVNSLSSVEKSLLSPSGFDDPVYQKVMYQHFKSVHCGYGAESYLSRLYDNWLARNDRMAATIAQVAVGDNKRPVVVIVGYGHTQFGMGAYERLSALAPELRQVNIGFKEIRSATDRVTDHIKPFSFAGRDFGLEFDFYWFTQGQPPKEDYCVAFLKHKADKAGKEQNP